MRARRSSPAGRPAQELGRRENIMLTILIVIAVLLLLGVLPAWPHSRNWGYYPSGGLGLVLVILVVLLVTGRL
jgi:Protein of unknown function (DUF3309)